MRDNVNRAAGRVARINRRYTFLRQGRIVDYNSSTHTMSVEVDGVVLPDIKYMDHVVPGINKSAWLQDIGRGRWIVSGVS